MFYKNINSRKVRNYILYVRFSYMFCAPSHSRMSFLMHKQVSFVMNARLTAVSWGDDCWALCDGPATRPPPWVTFTTGLPVSLELWLIHSHHALFPESTAKCDVTWRKERGKTKKRERERKSGEWGNDIIWWCPWEADWLYIYTQASSACVCENKIFTFSRVYVFWVVRHLLTPLSLNSPPSGLYDILVSRYGLGLFLFTRRKTQVWLK